MSENNKKMQLELLMEKLRHKTSHLNLTDCAKTFRMTILEKRYNNDSVEKLQYQKCLDLLQTNMKVTSLQSMLERLESISRQAGLKFTADGSGRAFFISSDMFYLEVIVEQGGSVFEVHIQHEGKSEPQTCNEIAVCLNSGNFSKFTSHLQGLCAIYQVSADKKLKAKAFAALSALEMDLVSVSKLQAYRQDIVTLVHKSPLGILMPRVGGLPLTLTYFLSPYDLVNVQSPTIAMTQEKILENNAGISCTVGIDSSTNFQLPISPLFSVTRNSEGESVPAFSPLSATNSASLPANFVLRMRDPLVLCYSFAQQIKSITGMELGNWDQPEYLFRSLVKTVSKGQMECPGNEDRISRALHVTLPDQQHSYFVTESEDVALKSCCITSIPFCHPSHVPQILAILRRQGLLNVLLSSCIRPKSQTDSASALTFEISAISLDHMSVTFEHPLLEQMCSVEIDLGMDPTFIRCSLFGADEERSSSDEYATKVLQRCLSIPVTMRAILRQMQSSSSRWTNGSDHQGSFERRFQPHINGDSDSHPGSNGQYGNPSFTGGGGGGFDAGHSPRTHNMGNSDVVMTHQSNPILHASTPKETDTECFGVEMEKSEDVVSLVEDTTSTNRSKTLFPPASELRIPTTLGNADSKYSANSHSSDSVLGVTLNNTTAHLNAVRKPNNDVSLKSDSIDMDVSVIEPAADGNQIIAEDADSLSSNDAVAALLNVAKSKESSSPKNKSAYPSVSITPVNSLHTSSLATTYPNINLERRPGIEIIPFSKDSPSSSIPSSLTITPVGGKPTKDKSKYKDFRMKESLTLDSETKDRDREKERERKERKRRREGEKSPSSGGSGGKPTKMMNLSATLMGPPGALLKMDSSPKLNHKNSSSGSNSISTPPSNASLSPLTSPSKSSSKSSTPSSSPKHPSSGGKPSMSTLSMSALKCTTSPSSKSKKSKDRDRERSDKERDRDKDRDRDRDRDKDKERDREKERDRDRDRDKERSRDREKKSRTPTPTSNHHHSRGPPLLKTKSLDFSLAVEDKSEETKEDNSFNSILALATANSEMLPSQMDLQSSIHTVTQELLSFSPPILSDSENCKLSSNTGGISTDGSMTCPSSGNPNKSPLRSRKSSLSAVIDKLRSQHNPESDIFQNSGPKYTGDPAMRMEQSEGRSSYMDEFMEESDSSTSPKPIDAEDNMHFNRIHSGSNSPSDPFSQDDSGINETTDAHEGELNGESLPDKEFVKPFPPPSARGTYGIRPHGYLSNSEADLNPNSPSVSVHIVNVPSPLALQQTRSPLANQLALVTAASGPSPASSTSQSSPCIIDDDLMDEALVGLGK